MATPLERVLDLLDLEELEVNIFRGRCAADDRVRVFGGQVLGQALVAAGRTVEKGGVHSLHAYFLRGGDPAIPILYSVERTRDGRSFTTRRVVAIQHGEQIFHMELSFHVDEPGFTHQVEMPDAPRPESLPTWHQLVAPIRDRLGAWGERERPIDMRWCDASWVTGEAAAEPEQRIWIRADGAVPDDPLLHVAVVAYASDFSLVDTAIRPHARTLDRDRELMLASIDHVMWFHRPFRADEWLLYAQESPSASGARGLSTGRMFTRDGALVVSVAQECLMRPIRAK